MTQTYPIPGMPYRIDWAKFHPHNVALREAARRKAQHRANKRSVLRLASKHSAAITRASWMASQEMQARRSAALAVAERISRQLSS